MLSVRISKEIENRLLTLSSRTHRSKSYYVKEALERYLEDEEDYLTLISSYEKHLRKGGKTYSLEEVKEELGLD